MAKKKQQEPQQETVESTVYVYVIDERTNNCIIILQDIDMPQKDDIIVFSKDGVSYEMIVDRRTLFVNAETGKIGWNIYVIPIGSVQTGNNNDSQQPSRSSGTNLAS